MRAAGEQYQAAQRDLAKLGDDIRTTTASQAKHPKTEHGYCAAHEGVDDPKRQQTLRAALHWSYTFLGASKQ